MSQTESPPAASHPSRGPGGTFLVFLIAGLIAGGASLGAVVLLKDFYKVSEKLKSVSPDDNEGQAELAAAEADVARKNLFLAFPVLGAVVGAVMGLAGGVRDRSFARALIGLFLGLVLGGGLGQFSAYLGPEVVGPRIDAAIPRTAPHETRQNWLMFSTVAVQATFWSLISLAAALAATLPARQIGPIFKSIIGALIVAVLAMMIYQTLLGNVFQVSRFELLLPRDLGPMAVWTLPSCTLLGLALGRLSVVAPSAPEGQNCEPVGN